MLRWRLLLGTIFVALIVVLCWLDASAAVPASWLFPLALVVTVLASGEMLWLMKARGLLPTPAVVYGGNVLILLSNWGPQFFPNLAQSPHTFVIMALTVAVMGTFVAEMVRYESPGGVTERLGGAVLALVYVGVLFSFVVQLRFLGTGAWGIAALGSLVAVTKCCDIGAYAVGRMVGRHKLVPKLSPGKTREGVAGGLIFACIAAVLTFAAFDQTLGGPGISGGENTSASPRWGGWLAFGLCVGAAGVIGDLAESLLKRDLGRKDSSAWMPGFGGVLDLLDSILFAAPIAYLFWALGWVGS